MDSSSDSSVPGEGESKKERVVVTDFAIEFRTDPCPVVDQTAAVEQAKAASLMETVCYKMHRVVDEKGSTTTRQMAERSSWRAREVEFLIVLRSTASRIFDQAVETKYRVSSLWENIAKQLPKEVDPGMSKSGKECQWMWNMLLREYTSVLGGAKDETEFPYFQDMDEAWKYFRPSATCKS